MRADQRGRSLSVGTVLAGVGAGVMLAACFVTIPDIASTGSPTTASGGSGGAASSSSGGATGGAASSSSSGSSSGSTGGADSHCETTGSTASSSGSTGGSASSCGTTGSASSSGSTGGAATSTGSAGTTPCTSQAPTDGLAAYYSFNKLKDKNIIDPFGGNNGILMGSLTPNPGPVMCEDALHFDGMSQYIDVTPTTSLQLTGNMTISAWVRLDMPQSVTKGDERAIVSKNRGALQRGWRLFVKYSSAKVVTFGFSVGFDGCNRIVRLSNTHNIDTPIWYHVIGLYHAPKDGGPALDIYVGTVQQMDTSEPFNLQKKPKIEDCCMMTSMPDQGACLGDIPEMQDNTQSAHVNIARDPSGPDVLAGAIDEVRIYNRALMPGEIADLR